MSLRIKDDKNGWSVADFEQWRPHLTEFVKARIAPLIDNQDCNHILICAPVKSGKREIVEYLAMRDAAYNQSRLHTFVSAFHRVADESQRREMKIHNLHVFQVTTELRAKNCLEWLEETLSKQKQVVMHIDECDFASGYRQILASVYRPFRDNENVKIVMYSATPQEVLFSGKVDPPDYDLLEEVIERTRGRVVEYNPPASFCGPARFLDENLVTEATPFFTQTAGSPPSLTDQGKEIVAGLRKSIADGSSQNIVVLRLSYSEPGAKRTTLKEHKAIYRFLKYWKLMPELDGFNVWVDKGEKDIGSVDAAIFKIQWSSDAFWRLISKDVPTMIIIDQTCSRSTELACHDRIYATHDYRHEKTFNTISQAQERTNHYEGKYGGCSEICNNDGDFCCFNWCGRWYISIP